MKWFKVLTIGAIGATLAACGSAGPPGQVGRISVSPTRVEVAANQSQSLSATVRDAAGNALSNAEVNWEVTDASVAKVASKGKLAATLTGLKSGQTEVYAVVGGVQSSPVQVVVSGDTPGPPSPPGPGEGSISGQLTAVTGSNLSGTYVEVCDATTKECASGQYNGTATQIPYTVKVPSGTYAVFGWRDLNNNGKPDIGDHLGCALTPDGSKCDIFDVAGAVGGKDIHLRLPGDAVVQSKSLRSLGTLNLRFAVIPEQLEPFLEK